MALEGAITRHTIGASARELDAALTGDATTIDLSGVTEIDSAGIALLAGAQRRASKMGRQLELTGASAELKRTLDLLPFPTIPEAEADDGEGRLEELGERGASAFDFALATLILAADVAWFTAEGLFKRKGIRWKAVVYEMSAMGSQALPVVGLIAFLIGGTMALQSAFQLRQFGANLFVADLVGVSMTRELGPLITAIGVAGRSGSAVAAELATMTITEEIDALRTMGLNPIRFLVVPKVIAITITQPLLTAFANALAIFGGFLVAVTYLEVGPTSFLSRLEEALYLKDLLTGLFKSVLFAQLIVTIGAVFGLRTTGGADAVGRSTTASVVAGIFAVIVADAIASLAFYFGG